MKIWKPAVLLLVLASALLALPLSAAPAEEDPIGWGEKFRAVYQETPEGREARARELAATQYLPYFTEIGFGVGSTEQLFGLIGRSGPALQGLNNSLGDFGLLISTYQMIVDVRTGAVKMGPRTLVWAKDATLWAAGRFGSRLVSLTALGLAMIDYSITSALSGILNEYETHWYEVYDWYFWGGPGQRKSDAWADCFEGTDTTFPKYRAAMDAFWTTPGNGFSSPEELFDHYYKNVRKMANSPINYRNTALANATMRDRFRARFFKARIGARVKVVLQERYDANVARLELEIRRRHKSILALLRSYSLLTVQVTDKESGKPVSSAKVAVKYPGGGGAKTTGTTGEVKLLIKRGAEADISVSAKGYKTESAKETGKKGGSTVTVKLEKEAKTIINVLVQDKKARAISGAQVSATWGKSSVSGQSDAAGSCTLTLAAEGAVTVTASAKGYKGASSSFTAVGAAKNITLTLERDEDEPRELLTVSVTALDGGAREWFQRGSRFIGKASEAELPEGNIGKVEWIIVTPSGKRVASKQARSGRAGMTITIKSTSKWPLGKYELIVIVHVEDEGTISGKGSFVLKDEYIHVDIKRPCHTGQWSPVSNIKGLPFENGDDLTNVRIEGIGKYKDSKFWRLVNKTVSFRPIEPGSQNPTFALIHKQDRAKCMGSVKVELTIMPVTIDWDKVQKVRKKDYVPFLFTLPTSFENPLVLDITPKQGVLVEKKPRKKGKIYIFKGHVILDDLPAKTSEIVINLTDKTDAVAQATIGTPDSCECFRPPDKIKRYLDKITDKAQIMAMVHSIKSEEQAEALGRQFVGDTMAFYNWVAGLKNCKHLSPRARGVFKTMGIMLRRLLSGDEISEAQGKAYVRQIMSLRPGDIKPKFMNGLLQKNTWK